VEKKNLGGPFEQATNGTEQITLRSRPERA
jgi:hypothetical protein